MSRASILIFLGTLILLVPFSGIPVAARSMLIVFFGACVLGVGLSFRVTGARNARLSTGIPVSEETNFPPEAPQRDPHGVSPI